MLQSNPGVVMVLNHVVRAAGSHLLSSTPCVSRLLALKSSGFSSAASASPQASSTPEPATPASSSGTGGPVYVACVLERLPVVAKPAPAWEAEYQKWLKDSYIRQGYYRDYPDVNQLLKPGTEEAKQAAPSSSSQQTAQSETTKPSTPSKPDDMRSMVRALDQRVYLVVKQKLGGSPSAWQFPFALNQGEESVRETCERALLSAVGRQYPAYFIGNAPMGYLPLNTPDGARVFFMLAQVVDDPWGPLTLNKTGHVGAPPTDYAWVTRDEAVATYFKDARMGELLTRMLPKP